MPTTTVILSRLLPLAKKLRIAVPEAPGSPHEKRFAGADGVRLSAFDWSGPPGAAPAALFLHGGGLCKRTWDFVCLDLSRDLRCLTVDLRGHGDSSWSADYRIETQAADIRAVTRALGPRPLHLVGLSLGGCVAAHAAVLMPTPPASLTLIEAGPGADHSALARMRRTIEAAGGVLTLDSALEAELEQTGPLDQDVRHYRLSALLKPDGRGGYIWKRDQQRAATLDHVLERMEDMSGFLPRLDCPVLVVRGERSRAMPEAAARRLADSLPRGRYAVVPDAGHTVNEDNPAALAALLRSFWAETGGVPAALPVGQAA